MVRVLEEGTREVAGRDESLLELIAAETVEKPELVSFNDWIHWRKTSGTRPTRHTGDINTKPKEEAVLWRHVMAELYGQTWKEDLSAQQERDAINAADEEEEQDAEAEETRGSLAVVAASAPAGSAGMARVRNLLQEDSEGESGLPTPTDLRKVLEAEPDPEKEDQGQWKARIMRTVASLDKTGAMPSDETLENVSAKAAMYIRCWVSTSRSK